MTVHQSFARRHRRGIIAVLGALLALALLAGVGWALVNPHRGQAQVAPTTLPLEKMLPRGDAVVDLEFVAELIEDRHVWTTAGLPPGFDAATQAEIDALPTNPAVVDVWRATQRMLVALGDGHTFSGAVVPDEVAYAVEYRVLGGDLHVRVGEALLPVLRVNGVDAAELVRRSRELTPADNDAWAEHQLVDGLTSGTQLALLGASPSDGYVVEYLESDGVRVLRVGAGALPPGGGPVAEFTVDDQLAVLTIHRCDPDDTYREVLAGFFQDVHDRALDRIVVDLRGNPGGDSRVTNLFVEYLDTGTIPSGSVKARYGDWVLPLGSGTMEGRKHQDPFGGEILVLTDHATFSSAADFAVMLSDNHLAQVVGASPGSAPTGAGDVVIFQLPHSGLFMQVSFKEFQRPDATRPRSILDVDIPADPGGTVEEMLAGLS